MEKTLNCGFEGENVAKNLEEMKGQIFVCLCERRDHTLHVGLNHSHVKIFVSRRKKQHETACLKTYKINVFIIISKFVDPKNGMRVV